MNLSKIPGSQNNSINLTLLASNLGLSTHAMILSYTIPIYWLKLGIVANTKISVAAYSSI